MSTRHGGQGGVIVNVSSRAVTLGMPGEYVHYAASKAAVNGLTKGLALEVAAEGIRVASVSPDLIDTELQLPERFARIAPTTPMRRAAPLTRWRRRSSGCYPTKLPTSPGPTSP